MLKYARNQAHNERGHRGCPRPKVGFSFRHTDPKYGIMVFNTEKQIARTKTALKLLGLAPWKNTHLLGTSNVISFFASANRWGAVWVGERGRWQMSIMSMTIRDSLTLFAVCGLDEKSS